MSFLRPASNRGGKWLGNMYMAFISFSFLALLPLLDTRTCRPSGAFSPLPPRRRRHPRFLLLLLLRGLYARSFSDRRRLRPLTPFRRTHFVASALTKMDESISERHSFRRNGLECALRFMVERMRGPWLALDWNRFSGLGVNPCLISHT